MAGDPKKKNESDSISNPYSAMTGPAMQPAMTSSFSNAGAAAQVSPISDQTDYGGSLGETSGPSATGYVNFDRLYGANQGVVKREAGRMAGLAEGKAKGARRDLGMAKNQFNSGLTGATAAGPTDAQRKWASYGGKEAGAGDTNLIKTGVNHQTEGTFATVENQGLDAGVHQGPDGQWVLNESTDGTIDHSKDAENEAAVRAGANSTGYTGPNALSEMEQYQALLNGTTAAQDEINALGSNEGLQGLGLNQTDAALLGAGGRPKFSSLRNMYGNLKSDVDKANKDSQAMSAAVNQANAKTRGAYQSLLDEYEGRQGAAGDKETPEERADRERNMLLDAERLAQRYEERRENPERAQGEYDSPAETAQILREFGLNVDGDTGRLTSEEDIATLQALGLTEADYAALNKMTPEQRLAWFRKRKKEKGIP